MAIKVHPVTTTEPSIHKWATSSKQSCKYAEAPAQAQVPELSLRCIEASVDAVISRVGNLEEHSLYTLLDMCDHVSELLHGLKNYSRLLYTASSRVESAIRASGSCAERTLRRSASESIATTLSCFIPVISSSDARRLSDCSVSWHALLVLRAVGRAISLKRVDCHAGSRSVRLVFEKMMSGHLGYGGFSLKELTESHVKVKRLQEVLAASEKNEEMSEAMELAKELKEYSEILDLYIFSLDDKLRTLHQRLIRCRMASLDALSYSY